jgi:hypothetical protein
MGPFPQLAEEKEKFIAYTAGSVGIALIASIFELSAFFVVSSCMMLMLTVPPLLQWLFCDEPPLSIRGELLTYAVPCFCFMVTYALPWLVAFTFCRTGSIIAALYRILIYRLSLYWVPHLILIIGICYYPERRRTFRKTSLEFLNMVTFYGGTAILKICEIAWKTYEMIMSLHKWLVEVRRPKIEFTYSRIDGKWNVDSETAKPTTGLTIRLLKLSLRNPISEISCRLEEFPLHSSSTPSYEAISYRWDDGEKRKDIIVNDLLLSVTSRAYEVLKGRSSLIRPRWIWIDAICIDQSKSYIISY